MSEPNSFAYCPLNIYDDLSDSSKNTESIWCPFCRETHVKLCVGCVEYREELIAEYFEDDAPAANAAFRSYIESEGIFSIPKISAAISESFTRGKPPKWMKLLPKEAPVGKELEPLDMTTETKLGEVRTYFDESTNTYITAWTVGSHSHTESRPKALAEHAKMHGLTTDVESYVEAYSS